MLTRLKNQRLGSWPVMVWVLLMTGSGCLIPQDETVFPTLPDKVNSPPRIVTASPPGPEITYFLKNMCAGSPLSVTVEDNDRRLESDGRQVYDALKSRWYLDRAGDSKSVDGATLYGMNSAIRQVVAPEKFRDILGSLTKTASKHVVEVFVTDGNFTESVGVADRPPRGQLPDGGELRDEAYVDSYVWILTLEDCP